MYSESKHLYLMKIIKKQYIFGKSHCRNDFHKCIAIMRIHQSPPLYNFSLCWNNHFVHTSDILLRLTFDKSISPKLTSDNQIKLVEIK